MNIDFDELGYIPVKPDDTFTFHCSLCGQCCHNVKDAIMLESLDFFRLTQFLRIKPDDMALQYTNMAYLSWGYPVLMLKTREGDTCVFLKGSRCRVQPSKPRACRTYPLGVVPDDENRGEFLSFIVSKRQHHFTEGSVLVRDWVDTNMTGEDRDFITADYQVTGEFAKLLRTVDRRYEEQVLSAMLLHRYLNYDTNKSFMKQYVQNMDCLKHVLSELTK